MITIMTMITAAQLTIATSWTQAMEFFHMTQMRRWIIMMMMTMMMMMMMMMANTILMMTIRITMVNIFKIITNGVQVPEEEIALHVIRLVTIGPFAQLSSSSSSSSWSSSLCLNVPINVQRNSYPFKLIILWYHCYQWSNHRLNNEYMYVLPRRNQRRMTRVMQLPFSFSTPFFLSPLLFTLSKVFFWNSL